MNDLALMIDAAHEAGHIATRFWRNSPKVWNKPDHQGPVTEADIAVDQMLRDTLMAARPDYGWLSEETADNVRRLGTRRTFVVDPIDGTRAFMNGDRTFAHSLAVVEDGQPIAGVVLLPLRDKLYTATRGGGAFLNGAPIQASPRTSLDGCEMLTSRHALEPEFWSGPVPDLHRHQRPSLAYRLCLIAEGRFDAMLTLRDSWDWDIAAGALIVAEAGAIASDRAGQPLIFNTPAPHSPGLIAGTPTVHAELVSRLG